MNEKGEILPENSEDITDEIVGKEFPIVGIGASAGGLAAFKTFFS